MTLPIRTGKTNSFTFFYAATLANFETGNLSVILQPGEVAEALQISARGQWRLAGEANWRDSGGVISNLYSGSYMVEFKPVSGWVAPPPRAAQVGANATYGTVGIYLVGASPSAETPAVVPFPTATGNEPYLYNGQIQTGIGFGSGFVDIQGFPGNSGGPLYVQADVNKYLPAAIYIGGSGETLVRAINSEVVDLINRAEISGNGGGNSTGGGVTLLSPGITAPPFGTGLLTVSLMPSNAANFPPGWRIAGYTDTNYVTEALATVALVVGGDYPIEFKAVPGFITPSNRTVLIAVGQTVTLQADYVPIRPLLSFDSNSGLSLSGATGASYKMEYTTRLAMPIAWTPLTTFTLISSPFTISGTGPATNGSGFYRAVLVP